MCALLFSKPKVKVQDLEQKCQTQSDKCNVLSEELEKLHLGLHADPECWTESTTSQGAICNLLNELWKACTRKGGRGIVKIGHVSYEFAI